MMRFAIVRHGQSGAINDYIGLNLFEEMPNVRFIPYICFDETIILRVIGKNIRMQGQPVSLYCLQADKSFTIWRPVNPLAPIINIFFIRFYI